jgi:hypothetical protein
VILVIREFRRRDHKAMAEQLDAVAHELFVTRQDFIAYQTWGFQVAQTCAGAGLVVPPLPTLHATAGGEDE